MLKYRNATPEDWPTIANIHAVSWQQNYRGTVSDDYLDNIVVNERNQVWEKRFASPNEKMITIIAEEDDRVVGFACTFLDYDEKHGAMLDNLHVVSGQQGKGIGRDLIYHSAKAVYAQRPETSLYLWVLATNKKATQFYEIMGGVKHDSNNWKTPDGRAPLTHRYVWTDIKTLGSKI